jgi:hypothetical protein
MPGIVLHPLTIAHLTKHFQIIARTLLSSLSLQELAFSLEEAYALVQLLLDRV